MLYGETKRFRQHLLRDAFLYTACVASCNLTKNPYQNFHYFSFDKKCLSKQTLLISLISFI